MFMTLAATGVIIKILVWVANLWLTDTFARVGIKVEWSGTSGNIATLTLTIIIVIVLSWATLFKVIALALT